jgi:hypothetical protein
MEHRNLYNEQNFSVTECEQNFQKQTVVSAAYRRDMNFTILGSLFTVRLEMSQEGLY